MKWRAIMGPWMRPPTQRDPGEPPGTETSDPAHGAADLMLGHEVMVALKRQLDRHNARHPDWKIKEVRCMPCSVTRGLGMRSESDIDGLTFYVEDRRGAIPPEQWAALKSDLERALSEAGIHFGGDYDPVGELALVRVDGRGRIFGHLFVQDGQPLPKPEEERISTLVLFRTDRKGRLQELENNTRCNHPGPLLSVYHKYRGLSKCEARLKLAYLLGTLDESALREAMTFDHAADKARLPHLGRLQERMLRFVATRPALSPAAGNLMRALHAASTADNAAAGKHLSDHGQDPAVLRRALGELLRHRLVKIDAGGGGIVPLWHRKVTLMVDDDRDLVALPTSADLLAQAESDAEKLEEIRIADVAAARRILAADELEADPFLRDRAVKMLGAAGLSPPDFPLLVGVLGDQHDVAAGSAITLLSRADFPELRPMLCRAIEEQACNEALCANAITVLGKRTYPDAHELAAVVEFLQRIVSGGGNGARANLRTCYSGIVTLRRLGSQDPGLQAAIRKFVDELAAARQTPKIISGLIRNLFSLET